MIGGKFAVGRGMVRKSVNQQLAEHHASSRSQKSSGRARSRAGEPEIEWGRVKSGSGKGAEKGSRKVDLGRGAEK